DIIRPDSGEILVNSLRSTAADMNRIGYLPEERGLYRKQKVTDVLDYFGRLKGMSGGHVRQEVLAALERVGLADWASRKVEEMCDRIAMIHQGRLVLYGRLEEIKRRFTAHLEPVTRIEVPTVSLEKIFVRVVERAEQEGEAALT